MSRLISRLRRSFNHPALLLAVAAALLAFAVQSGELGSSDTMHRLQMAHSFWTSEPPVFPAEYPEFGIHGRHGELETWYGIGQPLLLFPFDVLGTAVEHLSVFANYDGNDPSVRNVIVSFSVNILLCVLTALVGFRFLRDLGFSAAHAAAGALALLVATTHLHYTQNMMENNYICLLTLAGFAFQFAWTRTGARRDLLLGSLCLGLNLLTRLTTGIDLLAAAFFVALVLRFSGMRSRELIGRAKTYLAVALPVYCVFGLVDRIYQYHRFGSFFNTYVSVQAREARALDPSLPASFPFNGAFHAGFFGALFSPQKSIFLFDPLLVLMALLAILMWRRFRPAVKAYAAASAAMLLAYICFYARYFAWAGDTAWGDRYAATAAQLAALLAVPLLLELRCALAPAIRVAAFALVAAAVLVQLASVAFWCPLERYQMDAWNHPACVVFLRMRNIAAFALGKMGTWDLFNASMCDDAWDYQHITCWNFLPFVLARLGAAPAWAVRLALCAWAASLAGLAAVLFKLRAVLMSDSSRPGARS